MPDRVIRSADGFYGGLLMILGVYYLGLGVSWMEHQTESRVAGIAWAAVPDWLVHPWSVAALWFFAGAVCLVGGALSKNRVIEIIVGQVAVLVPFILGAFFAAAWVLTPYGYAHAPTGLTTAWSYWLPAVIAGWAFARAPRHFTVVRGADA